MKKTIKSFILPLALILSLCLLVGCANVPELPVFKEDHASVAGTDGEIKGNGFTFANYSSSELEDRINAALALYEDKAQNKKFISKVMGTDFSWSVSAGRYMEMFNSL